MLRHHVDHAQRILYLDLNNGISAQRARGQAMGLLKALPDLWNWDWIVEARIVPVDASVAQIERLMGLFHRPERSALTALTVLASHDRFLHLWARVMEFQFPGRKHLVVSNAAEALRLIGQTRVSMKMNRI